MRHEQQIKTDNIKGKRCLIEKIYLCIFLICTVLVAAAALITGDLYGGLSYDIQSLPGSASFRIVCLVLFIATYLGFYLFYTKTRNLNIPVPKIECKSDNMHRFISAALIFKIAGAVLYGIGCVNHSAGLIHNAQFRFSFLFNLVTVEHFFYIYYISFRDRNSRNYRLNLILFIALRVIQGWSGWILSLGFIEIYLYYKERPKFRDRLNRIGVLPCSAILLGLGGAAYIVAQPVKGMIRLGRWVEDSFTPKSFFHLFARLTSYPNFDAAVYYRQEIARLYRKQDVLLSELRCTLRPVVPSFIMRDKTMSSINNLLMSASFGAEDTANFASINAGFLGYWSALFTSSKLDFALCATISVGLFLLTYMIFRMFEHGNHELNLLYFMFLMSLAEGAGMETVYSSSYASSVFLIALMFVLRVIRIRRNVDAHPA